MSMHDEEYRHLTALAAAGDRSAIISHWELGHLFARYGEAVTDIAQAIGRSVTFVSNHLLIARSIPAREGLDAILANRDDIYSWTVLVEWVRDGGPDGDEVPDAGVQYGSRGKSRTRETGGLQLMVPASTIKALADLGCNAREVMTLFWQNASPNLIVSVAYPDRVDRVA